MTAQNNRHHRRLQRREQDDVSREFLPNEGSCPVFVNADLMRLVFHPSSRNLRLSVPDD